MSLFEEKDEHYEIVETIEEVRKKPIGTRVKFMAMITSKRTLQKKGNIDYLTISVQDASGFMSFPIWDDYKELNEALQEKQKIIICGVLTTYLDEPQIKNPRFHILTEEELQKVKVGKFVPAYSVSQNLVDKFLELIDSMKEPWRTLAVAATGSDTANTNNRASEKHKERWEKFTTCVSAEKHHGNRQGGLFLHTLGVALQSINIVQSLSCLYDAVYPHKTDDIVDKSRLLFKAIVHDLMKWEEYDYESTIARKDGVIGHVYDGITYVTQINEECCNPLSKDELENVKRSILSHHGKYGPIEPNTAEDWIIHLADMLDSRIVGELEK